MNPAVKLFRPTIIYNRFPTGRSAWRVTSLLLGASKSVATTKASRNPNASKWHGMFDRWCEC